MAGQAVLGAGRSRVQWRRQRRGHPGLPRKAKTGVSINAEGTAPKLATIDWYNKNNGGKIPNSDGLLSASVPGVIDAWYVLLDRWGTMTLRPGAGAGNRRGRKRLPDWRGLARAIAGSKKIQKYPIERRRCISRMAEAPQPGDIFRNLDSARMLRKLVEAEQAAAAKAGTRRCRRRAIASIKATSPGPWRSSPKRTAAFIATRISRRTPPRSKHRCRSNYRGYEVYKNPSSSQGPAELFLLNILEGYDVKKLGHNSPEYIHTSVEALKLAFADREKLGDTDFVKIPYEGLLSKAYAAERRKLIDPDARFARDPARQSRAVHESRRQRRSHRPVHVNLEGEADHEGDTSYIAVVDKDRNMVSFEPSLHSGFGTGVVMADLGFIFNCRGDYYSLTPGEATRSNQASARAARCRARW